MKKKNHSSKISGEFMHLEEAEEALSKLQARAKSGDASATEDLCIVADEILAILVSLASTNHDLRATEWLGYRSELGRNKIPESSPKSIKKMLREKESTKSTWDRAASWADFRFKGDNKRKIHKRSQAPLVQWVEEAIRMAEFWREIGLGIAVGEVSFLGVFEDFIPPERALFAEGDAGERAFEAAKKDARDLLRRRWEELVENLTGMDGSLCLGEVGTPPFPWEFVESGADSAFVKEVALPLLEATTPDRKKVLGIPPIRGDLKAAVKTALEHFREVSSESIRRRQKRS